MRQAPFQIPGYRLLRVLGKGGMGTVYHARHESTGNEAAIKVFDPKPGSLHNEMLRRFRHEMVALTRLCHPNIVHILHADEIDGVNFLIMEYVAGVDLEELLEQRGRLPVALACEYLIQAARGLQHAHEQGLVHRDIKPANILVAASGMTCGVTEGTVKLLDLGLARLFSMPGHSSLSLITEDGLVVGTPDYIAPEQIANSHQVDIRADIYSLGCTFYQLLTGQVPFPAADVLSKLDRHRWNPGRPVEQLRPEVPRKLGDIVRKMMAKQPAARYQTPLEVCAALEEIRAELPLEHGIPGIPATAGVRAAEEIEAQNAGGTVFEAHAGAVHAVAFLPDGKHFVSAGEDHLLQVWDLERAMRVRSLRGHNGAVQALALSADGRRLVSAGSDGRAMLWDVASGKHLRTLQRQTTGLVGVACLPDGQRVLLADADGKLYLRQFETGVLLQTLSGHRAAITAMAASGAGRHALSAALDNSVRLWDLDSGQETFCLDMDGPCFHGVALSRDGLLVLAARADLHLHVWHLDTGSEQQLAGHQAILTCVALADNEQHALSGSAEGGLLFWDLSTDRPLCPLAGHTAAVNCVTFAPDGCHALSGDRSGHVRFWQLPG
ncbi:MAG: protein kinase [Gemmataceae bacterium]